MTRSFLTSIALGSLLVAAGSATAGTVDLTTWTGAEGGGTWTIQAGNDSVFQSANGSPTVFYSGVDSQGLSLSGEITVQTTGDDDFIGFVLGYNSGDLTNGDANYLLIDWKQNSQYAYGQADLGLAISLVTGALTLTDAWSHTGDVTELARATTLGSTGWQDNTTYLFDLVFTSSLVEVYVNDVLELSVAGSFSDGSFGFYNFSQGSVLYAGLTEDVAPDVGVVPLPAGGLLLLSALSGLVVLRRRVTRS